jgi:hypothetical protein
MSWASDVEAVAGRRGVLLAGAAVVAGAAAFITGLGGGRAPSTYGALISSWLFFAGLALGAVAFAALFRVIPARWARPMVALGRSPTGFGATGLVLLVVIVSGASAAPWVAGSRGWLATPFLVGRQLLLYAAVFGMARMWFGHRAKQGKPSLSGAVGFLIVYAVVLSIWAFDFVLGPDPVFGSTVIGPFLFVTAFLAGADLLALLALVRGGLSDANRSDAVSLLLTVTIFWAYLFAAQFLTIWYGNLPDETGFLLRRMQGGWGWLGLLMLLLVFAGPFTAFLHPAARRAPQILKTVLVSQLGGAWLICQILVVPTLAANDGGVPISPRNALIALGVLGAFVLSVSGGLRRDAPPGSRDDALLH